MNVIVEKSRKGQMSMNMIVKKKGGKGEIYLVWFNVGIRRISKKT